MVLILSGVLLLGWWLTQRLSSIPTAGSESNQTNEIAETNSEQLPDSEPTATPTSIATGEVVITDAAATITATPVIPTKTPAPTKTTAPTATFTPTSPPTHTPTPTDVPTFSPETITIGYSVDNNPITAMRFGMGPETIIFIGGLHAGFAPSTVTLAQQTITYFTSTPGAIPANITVYIISNANPDALYDPGNLAGRLNSHQVDLNRNWDCRWVKDAKWRGDVIPGSGGTAPFSEPETITLRDFILDMNPVSVVFWEARADGGLASPGNCNSRHQGSETLALAYGLAAGYQIDDFERLTAQELNGDGTNWLAQQNIPAMAILLPSYTSTDWNNNLDGIVAVLDLYAQ
ncbi:MAG: hypothetical protein KA338_21140 [Chloroflexi bacterium]|nr:hypothetical protein [Chloroflexota bacterium]